MVSNCTDRFEAVRPVAATSSSSGNSNNSNRFISGSLGSDGVQKETAPKQLFVKLLNIDAQPMDTSLRTTLKIVCTSQAKPRLKVDLLFERLRHFYPGEVGCFAKYLLNYILIDPSNAFVTSINEHAHTPRQTVHHTHAAPPSPQFHSPCRIFFRP